MNSQTTEPQFKGRNAGIDMQRIKDAKSIIDLNNVERFVLELANTAQHSNTILTAAATRWCSTVESKLSMEQARKLALACINDANVIECISDMVGFFDKITGYVQKPKGEKAPPKVKIVINKGVFANS